MSLEFNKGFLFGRLQSFVEGDFDDFIHEANIIIANREIPLDIELADQICNNYVSGYGIIEYEGKKYSVNELYAVYIDENQIKIVDDDDLEEKLRKKIMGEEEDEPECCGKHCSQTKNLKLVMGWNRLHFTEKEMITEQLFCEDCIEEYTTSKCKGCSDTYKYTDMEYRDGGNFGEALYGHDDFFCKSCIKHINSLEIEGEEEEIYIFYKNKN